MAICEVDPDDLDSLGVGDDGHVRVTTESGSVVLMAERSRRGPHPGVAYIPYGVWANVLTGSSTGGTGMPTYKGIPAEVEPAPGEPVMRVRELLQHYYGK